MLSYMSHSGLNTRCQTSFVTRVRVCACVTTRLHKRSVNDVQAAKKNANCGQSGHKDGASVRL